MKKLMRAVSEWLKQGEDVVLASIIADSGSTPRGAGARMAVTSGGRSVGTIGGGAVEYKVTQIALDALKTAKSETKTFILSPNQKEDLGMICGGNVTVYIQYISSGDEKAKNLFARGAELFSENTDTWLVTDITDENAWGMEIYTQNSNGGNEIPEHLRNPLLFTNRGVQAEIAGKKYYSEPLTRAGKTYIFGGGHIAQELVPLLSHLGFSCVVFDNLEQFTRKELFPNADRLITGDFDNISAQAAITENDYAVIMTRGHSFDLAVQAQVMKLRPRYIGVIGSRKKIAAVSQKLSELGFSREEIEKIHTPIGIAIKADTPAEIAVSIAAELILTRAEGAS